MLGRYRLHLVAPTLRFRLQDLGKQAFGRLGNVRRNKTMFVTRRSKRFVWDYRALALRVFLTLENIMVFVVGASGEWG